ncbi:hypothetical protein LLE87_31770, partial [Paenibacillus polymyxa]|nr:hypothetical protein [Paenibacillus polymyxa]
RVVLVVALVLVALATAASAQSSARGSRAKPGPCVESALPGGARALTCVPRAGWNGQLVVFAPGFGQAGTAPAYADLRLQDGTRLPDLIQELG